MPKHCSSAVFHFDVTKRGAWQPCTIKKTFHKRGYAHPPHRINNYKMIGGRYEFLKLAQIRFAHLLYSISLPQSRIKLHFSNIHTVHAVTRDDSTLTIRIGNFSAKTTFIWMAKEHEYFFVSHAIDLFRILRQNCASLFCPTKKPEESSC